MRTVLSGVRTRSPSPWCRPACATYGRETSPDRAPAPPSREDTTPHATDHRSRHTDHETLSSMPRETLVHYLQQQLHVSSTLG